METYEELKAQHWPNGWMALKGTPYTQVEMDAMKRWAKAHLEEVAANIAYNAKNPDKRPKEPNIPSTHWVLIERIMATIDKLRHEHNLDLIQNLVEE